MTTVNSPSVENGDFFTKVESAYMQNEPSRLVKIFFIKFKCIVVFSLVLITFLQFVYILVNAIISNTDTAENIQLLLNSLIQLTDVSGNQNDPAQASHVFLEGSDKLQNRMNGTNSTSFLLGEGGKEANKSLSVFSL